MQDTRFKNGFINDFLFISMNIDLVELRDQEFTLKKIKIQHFIA